MNTLPASPPFHFRTPAPAYNTFPRQFVSQNLRRLHVPIEDLFDIRPANAAGRPFDQHFAVPHLPHRHFLHPHNSLLPIHARPHPLGHLPPPPSLLHHRPRPPHPPPPPPPL